MMTTRRLRFVVGTALLVGAPAASGCDDGSVINPVPDGGMDAGRDAGEEVINVYPDSGPDSGFDAGEEIINVYPDTGPEPELDAGIEAGVEDAGEDAGPIEDAGEDAGPVEA